MPKEFSDGKTVKWTPVKVVKAVKKPITVKKTAKRIVVGENKTKYGKRIKQLKVIINEYLKASDYFVENSQKGYLNAILDKISKVSRIKDEI